MSRDIQSPEIQEIMTSDPAALVALLYDKAVSCLTAAIQAIHRGEIEERWRNSHRAQEIINHLLMTLDLEEGGEVASNLEALYAYMLRRLIDVDVKNDPRAAEEVIELLDPLRASWRELAGRVDEFKIDTLQMHAIATATEDAETRQPAS